MYICICSIEISYCSHYALYCLYRNTLHRRCNSIYIHEYTCSICKLYIHVVSCIDHSMNISLPSHFLICPPMRGTGSWGKAAESTSNHRNADLHLRSNEKG